MNWVNKYVDDYYRWLKEHTHIEEDSNTNWSVISTPFLGAFNDTIDIYAQKKGNTILLSDNGDTFYNLKLQGLSIQKSKKRKNILKSILLNYGIKYNDNELLVESDFDNFAQTKHNFLSAIIEINDLYILSENNVSSIFKEDVRNFLDNENIIYTPDFISKGITGLEFNFDFQIAKRDSEIVLKSFNTINISNLSSFLFAWNDIKPLRTKVTKKDVKAVAILNDVDKEIKNEYIDALKSKEADFILWSEKESKENREKLAA